ncbi:MULTISPECIES: hypothetical protein [Rhizobium]|nr:MULTISPECIES: hypothetical protein [Rhizobium]UWU35979.1 hypothetical protein N2597_06645 [Rhizobium leguminosarum bv. phaseoli]
MRIMIAVVAFMVASVLSIAILSPSGAGQSDRIEASVNEPVAH